MKLPQSNAPEQRTTQTNENTLLAFWFLLITTVAIFLRFYAPLLESYPVNDGGLFYQMILDIKANGWRLPAFTTYNNSNIPLAYPPLALYLTGLIHAASGIELMDLFRFLPPLWSSLLLWPAWAIIRELLDDPHARLIAFAIFGLNFPGFEWLIMGGGVTRAFGYLLATTAIALYLHATNHRSFGSLLGSLLSATAAALSHPQAWPFLAVSIAVLALRDYREKELGTLILHAVAYALTLLPWLVLEIILHGFTVLTAASSSSYTHPEIAYRGIFSLINGVPGASTLVNVLFILGIIVTLAQGKLWPLSWFAFAFVLPRFSGVTSAIPLALLCGFGFSFLVCAFESQSLKPWPILSRYDGKSIFLALIMAVQGASAFIPVNALRLETLQESERQAFEWIEHNTPSSAKFLIITKRVGQRDYLSEWFPALTGRYSLLTFEGREWLGHDEFFYTYGLRYQVGQLIHSPKLKPNKEIERTISEANYILVDEAYVLPSIIGYSRSTQKFGVLELYNNRSGNQA